MTLAAFIRKTAAETPGKEALVFRDRRLTYTELDAESDGAAHFLSGIDLVKGDRVGTLMPNCVENVLVFLAVLKCGGIEVNITPDMPAESAIRVFREAGIKILVASEVVPDKLRSIIQACPAIERVILERRLIDTLDRPDFLPLEELFQGNPDPYQERSIDSDPGLIQYTSGTTGEPKGALLSQKNFIEAALARQQLLNVAGNLRLLNPLRLSHSCGKSLLFDTLVTGATLVLTRGFVPPSGFLKTILEEEIDQITGPPFLFHQLLKLRSRPDVIDRLASSLKILEIGMAGAPPRLFHELRNTFPSTTLINRYGVTEYAGAASMMIHRPGETLSLAGSCGKPVPGSVVEWVENTGQPHGRTEIRISGPGLMIGYWSKPDSVPAYNGRRIGFETGDLAQSSAEGHLFITGRKDDLILVAGERVMPEEIEAVISGIPDISEVAAFGIHDDLLGQRIAVCYYGDGNPQDRKILDHCRLHLPPYMVPHVLLAASREIPKNPAGKISRRFLRNQYEQGTLAID